MIYTHNIKSSQNVVSETSMQANVNLSLHQLDVDI